MMISANTPPSLFRDYHAEVPAALDNGAYPAFEKGQTYNPLRFLETLQECQSRGIALDFVVMPDIRLEGKRSLETSLHWAQHITPGPTNALAVQDGITPEDAEPHLDLFSHLFIGGSQQWKWEMIGHWVQLARETGTKCHVGAVSTVKGLARAKRYGADSVDSTTFARNKKWHLLEEFAEPTQMDMTQALEESGVEPQLHKHQQGHFLIRNPEGKVLSFRRPEFVPYWAVDVHKDAGLFGIEYVSRHLFGAPGHWASPIEAPEEKITIENIYTATLY